MAAITEVSTDLVGSRAAGDELGRWVAHRMAGGTSTTLLPALSRSYQAGLCALRDGRHLHGGHGLLLGRVFGRDLRRADMQTRVFGKGPLASESARRGHGIVRSTAQGPIVWGTSIRVAGAFGVNALVNRGSAGSSPITSGSTRIGSQNSASTDPSDRRQAQAAASACPRKALYLE